MWCAADTPKARCKAQHSAASRHFSSGAALERCCTIPQPCAHAFVARFMQYMTLQLSL